MTRFGRLIAPLSYLRVQQVPKDGHRRHYTTKIAYDFVWPAVGGSLVAAAALAPGFWPGAIGINVFQEYGLVHGVNQLLQLLVGFYVAALAAVATFSRPGLDEPTGGDALILDGKKSDPLSRRRFACLVFGHLAIVGFCLYVVGVFAMALTPSMRDLIGSAVVQIDTIAIPVAGVVRVVFAWLYLVVAAHMFIVTLYGVYFLAIRVQTMPSKTNSGRQE